MLVLRGGMYCIDIENQARAILTTLNSNEIKHISEYTSDLYKKVNCCLRENKSIIESDVSAIIDSMNKVFCKIKGFKPTNFKILYRGMKPCDGTKKCMLQNEYTDLGYVSTTTDIDIAQSFADVDGSVIKIYLIPKFTYKILPVKNCSKMGFESEIILPSKSRFKKISDKVYACIPHLNTSEELSKEDICQIQKHEKRQKESQDKIKAVYDKMACLIVNDDFIKDNVIESAIEETKAMADLGEEKPTLEDCLETYIAIIKAQYSVVIKKDNPVIERIKTQILLKANVKKITLVQ